MYVMMLITSTIKDYYYEMFPRQDPTLAIQSFINNGVRPALIPILMSFFENRRMTVKCRDAMSATIKIEGRRAARQHERGTQLYEPEQQQQ